MAGTEDLPLCLTGAYAPLVISTGLVLQTKRALTLMCHPDASGPGALRTRAYRLLLVEQGGLRLGDGGLRAGRGGVLLLVPGTCDRLRVAPGSLLLSLLFTVAPAPLRWRDDAPIFPNEAPQQPSPRAVWGRALPALVPAALLRRCSQAMRRIRTIAWRSRDDRLRANAVLVDFLAALATSAAPRAPDGPARAATNRDVLIGVTVRRALATLDGSVVPSVGDLAADAALSARQLQRRFRAELDIAPSHWLRRERLDRLARDLLEVDEPISVIAARGGYASPAAFARAFRARHGVTPSAWRRAHGAAPDA